MELFKSNKYDYMVYFANHSNSENLIFFAEKLFSHALQKKLYRISFQYNYTESFGIIPCSGLLYDILNYFFGNMKYFDRQDDVSSIYVNK